MELFRLASIFEWQFASDPEPEKTRGNGMTREEWIALVKQELRHGPLRFHYSSLKITYILHDLGFDSGDTHYPSYALKIERRDQIRIDSSWGPNLERLLEAHPLDRFTPEREFDALLLEYARAALQLERTGRLLAEPKPQAVVELEENPSGDLDHERKNL